MSTEEKDKAPEETPARKEMNEASEPPVKEISESGSRKLRSQKSSGMESSVLKYKNVNYIVGKGDKQKYILRDVSGVVKFGHVLASMGPSGAGKTTLINALTLDAFFGRATGSVTLNGVPMTDKIFKSHCYVVVQHDKHWPYLTCHETLRYAAELFDVASPEDINLVVDEIIKKMGLDICRDTRNARLSGGQKRRLSIGIALLKQPTLLFLDEPTTGLDAAASENIMQEIVRVAREEHIIIMCTIHQPSTKVYESFDMVQILSKGREAFTGDVKDAVPYFESIGYPLPVQMNPAEHFLDLVNADFSDDAEVDRILDTWEERRPEAGSSHHKNGNDVDEQEGVVELKRAPLRKELVIMFRRHMTLIIRDPILYLGRAISFLVINSIFALVYLKSRKYNQDQALNKMWIDVWFIGVPSQLGSVAVYALNDEFKTIVRESKNGMVGALSYVFAKSLLVLPMMIVFALFGLLLPAVAIIDFKIDTFPLAMILYAALMYSFECVAECLSVWFDDPILGMLQYMNFWFGSFLFAGFLIPKSDLFWPFTLFYYVMPFGYYVRSSMYNFLIDQTFAPCYPDQLTESQPVCVPLGSGADVLQAMSKVYPLLSTEDRVGKDIGVLIAIALFYKAFYIIGVFYKTRKTAKIYPN